VAIEAVRNILPEYFSPASIELHKTLTAFYAVSCLPKRIGGAPAPPIRSGKHHRATAIKL